MGLANRHAVAGARTFPARRHGGGTTLPAMRESVPGQRRPVVLAAAPVGVLVGLDDWLGSLFDALEHIDTATVPPRLVQLGDALKVLIERPRLILADQVEEADDDDAEVIDLNVDLGLESATRIARMMLILDELDEWSRAGRLDHTPRTPEQVAVLRWIGREIIGQIEIGRAPRPFRPPAGTA